LPTPFLNGRNGKKSAGVKFWQLSEFSFLGSMSGTSLVGGNLKGINPSSPLSEP